MSLIFTGENTTIMKNIYLNSDRTLTKALRDIGISTWEELISYIKHLPYGRTSSRSNLTSVIRENRGTCSSKHALAKAVAIENKIPNVHLILCIYKMTSKNTMGIGNDIDESEIEYIPEAHCYIEVDNQKIDLTNPNSDLKRINNYIIHELKIEPNQIGIFKVEYHKKFIKEWIDENSIPYTMKQVWELRENCIQNLSCDENASR